MRKGTQGWSFTGFRCEGEQRGPVARSPQGFFRSRTRRYVEERNPRATTRRASSCRPQQNDPRNSSQGAHWGSSHGYKGVRRRIGVWLVASTCGLLPALVAAPAPATAQVLNEDCVVTLLNRSVRVRPDGTFLFTGVPTVPGLYRIRAVCTRPDGTVDRGMSALFRLTDPNIDFGTIDFANYQPPPVHLRVFAANPVLHDVGETTTMVTLGETTDGTALLLTGEVNGTTYASSDPTVASVDANGVVTAHARGEVVITAQNESLVATATVAVILDEDADKDGMPDTYEKLQGLNPLDPSDAAADDDGDGLTNATEYDYGTQPHLADTDGDGVDDGTEVGQGTNPLEGDTDGDGLVDGDEAQLGTDPLVADSDGDGVIDGTEVQLGLDPLLANPTTTVRGRVVDDLGAALAGASIVVYGDIAVTAADDGTFEIPNVPKKPGPSGKNLTVRAFYVSGSHFRDARATVPVVVGGVTDVGTLTLHASTRAVYAHVVSPSGGDVQGAQVKLFADGRFRTKLSDASGGAAFYQTPPGPVAVEAVDPATGLRARAEATLAPDANVAVLLQLLPSGTLRGTATLADGTTRVGAGVDVTLDGPGYASVLQTDVFSRWRFGFVPLGVWTVEMADALGHRGRTVLNLNSTNQVVETTLSFLGQGTVLVHVETPTGIPVANAQVSLSGQGIFNQSLSATTDSQGDASFHNVFQGPFAVSVLDPSTGLAGAAAGDVPSDGAVVTTTVVVEPSATIQGVVVEADGTTPAAGVAVSTAQGSHSTTTASDGTFQMTGLPLGTWTLRATDSTTGDVGTATVVLSAPDQVYGATIRLNGVAHLEVGVVDHGGVPVSNAPVTVTGLGPHGGTWLGTTDGGGTVSFPHVLAGPLRIDAADPQHLLGGSVQTTVVPGEQAVAVVTLEAAGTIAGHVYLADGTTPAVGVQVNVSPDGRTATTGSDGSYAIDMLAIATGVRTLRVYDDSGQLRAVSPPVTLSTHGQVATVDLVMTGTGTVEGQVTWPDGTPATGAYVWVTSQTSGATGKLATTGSLGQYSVSGVLVGPLTVTAIAPGAQGSASASSALSADGQVVTVNLILDPSQSAPPPGGGGTSTNPWARVTARYDANGAEYGIPWTGALHPGVKQVFQGDASVFLSPNPAQHGALNLWMTGSGGTTQAFVAQSASANELGGRQVVLSGTGPDGLEVSRRIYVPTCGYFARYVDVLTNPGTTDVTVRVEYTSWFRRRNLFGGNDQGPMTPVATSSGDNVVWTTGPDNWVVFDDNRDNEPFDNGFNDDLPPVAFVFGDASASLQPSLAQDLLAVGGFAYDGFRVRYDAVTVPAGGSVAIMQFVAQSPTRAAAIAAAQRLAQLPPEALDGTAAAPWWSALANFTPPAIGTGPAALPACDATVQGTVFEADGATPVTGSTVRMRSTNPLFARTWEVLTQGDGTYRFVADSTIGQPHVRPLRDAVTVWAVHPTTALRSLDVSATPDPANPALIPADIVFSNGGIIAGTVRRTDGTVVSTGTVTVSSNTLLDPAVAYVQTDGTFTTGTVPEGTYTLVAELPVPDGDPLHAVGSATVVAGQTIQVPLTIEPTGTVAVAVTSAQGDPAVDVAVELRDATGHVVRTRSTDTGGTALFVDVPLGSWTAVAKDPVTGLESSAAADVTADGQLVQVAIQLNPHGSVDVTVTYADGSGPVANAPVVWQSAALGSTWWNAGTTNLYGHVLITGVPVGAVTVRATHPANANIEATASGSVDTAGQVLALSLSMPVDAPPQVALTSPAPGSTVLQGAPVPLAATASDDFGVAQVAFLIDGTQVGVAGSPPWQVTVPVLAAPGSTVTVQAIATDTSGNTASSTPVALGVLADTTPPTVAIDAPADGASVVEGTTVTVQASASDDAAVASLTLDVPGVLNQTSTSPPWTWDVLVPGDYATNQGGTSALALTVTATDPAGNTSQASVNLQVVADQPPQVSWKTAPAAGATIVEGTSVALEGNASDDLPGVKVELLVNGAVAAARTAAPWVFTWIAAQPASGNTVTLQLRATDSKGQTALSAPLDVNVVADAPPTISVLSPTDGSTVTEGSTVQFAADVTDDVGVAKVVFKRDGVVLATAVVPPWTTSLTMPPGAAGQTVTLSVEATDTAGQTSTATVTLTRADDLTPPTSVTLTAPPDGATLVLGKSDVVFVVDATQQAANTAGADYDGDGQIDTNLEVELAAAKAVLAQLDSGTTKVAVVRVGVGGATVVQALTTDYAAVQTALDGIGTGTVAGWFDVDWAMDTATGELASTRARVDAAPVQMWFAPSVPQPASAAQQRALDAGVVIDTFAVGSAAASAQNLQGMAAATQGTFVPLDSPATFGSQIATASLVGVDTPVAAADAVDDVAIEHVEFHITSADGSIDVLVTDHEAPWARAFVLPPLGAAKQLTIVATAYDFGGNAVASSPHTVTALPAQHAPEIVRVDPPVGRPGQTASIYGRYFEPNWLDDIVTLGGVAATANGGTKFRIDVTWPQQATSADLVVTTSLGASAPFAYSIDRDGDGLIDEDEAALGTDPNNPDTDADGLQDGAEVHTYQTDPLVVDTDGGGAGDGFEVQWGFDPLVAADDTADPDADGLNNAGEDAAGTNPTVADTDGDGLQDGAEVNTYLTDPLVVDTDGGGATDGFEVTWGLNPLDAADDTGDLDSDGLANADEQQRGTDPSNPDTDADGLQDGAEVNTYQTDPLVADTDGDGLQDGAEVNTYQTNPTVTDSDGDGLGDGAEVNTYLTDPTLADTDADGLQDGAEVNTYQTDPLVADTDADGLQDGAEVNTYQTDPLVADTDGDGLSDGDEVNVYGTDPLLYDVCKVAQCDAAGVCTLVDDPACCTGLSEGFEGVALPAGWTTSAAVGACAVQPDAASASAGAQSLFLGDAAVGQYDCAAGSLWVETGSVQLGASGNWVEFWANVDVSNGDAVRLEVVAASGAATVVWHGADLGVPAGTWKRVAVLLDAWAGQAVRLRWVADFAAHAAAPSGGMRFDALRVVAPCPQAACTADADCADGDACTQDLCQGALLGCVHPAVNCDDSNACTADGCDPATGCTHTALACNDGNACTADSCDPALGCQHTALNCDDANQCTTDGCDPTTGCTHTAVSCDDNDACTADSCDPAAGCVHTAVSCNDGIACTTDSCDPATGCTHTPDDAACADAVQCTVDACDAAAGGCTHTALAAACDDGNVCTTDTCDVALDCQHAPADGAACDDGSACTTNDACAGGACVGGPPPNCDDGNACTTDACDPATGCTHADNTASCDDGIPCTVDTCDPASGCVHTPSDALCDDGVACTVDTCDGATGACAHAADVTVCDDANPCTTDTCDVALDCQHTALDGVACDDGNPCTTGESCVAGVCTPATTSQCDDGNPCTDDACDPNGGCIYTNNTLRYGTCQTGLPAACGAGVWQCQDGAAYCVPDIADYGAISTVTVPAGLLYRDTGKVEPGDALLTANDRYLFNVAYRRTPGSYDGFKYRIFDPTQGFALVKEAAVGAQSFYTDGIVADDQFIYVIEWTGSTGRVWRIDWHADQLVTGNWRVSQWANTPGQINGQYDWAHGEVVLSSLYTGHIYRYAGNPWAPADTGNWISDTAINHGGGVLATDGVYVYTKRWSTYAGVDRIGRSATGYGGTTAGAFAGWASTGPTTTSVSMAYYPDGYIYNPVSSDPYALERIHVTAAVAERCDGIDNDCDGSTDEAFALEGSVCVVGPCATNADCDDGIACTVDACDGGTGCVHTPDVAACDDGLACTVDACDPTAGCTHTADATVCDDGNQCTTDTCDLTVGCQNIPQDGTACDDGNACTSSDTCVTGTCTGGPAVNCDDANPCTDDACDPATGCTHTNNTVQYGTCTTAQPGACSAGVWQCEGGAAYCVPSLGDYGVISTVSVPDGLIARDSGQVEPGDYLITANDRYLFNLAYRRTPGALYDGFKFRVFDPLNGMALVKEANAGTHSFYADGVVADDQYLYAIEWTNTPVARVWRIDWHTGQLLEGPWTVNQSGGASASPVNGQLDWVHGEVVLGALSGKVVYRYPAGPWAPNGAVPMIPLSNEPSTTGVLATDGFYLYAKRWDTYAGDDVVRRFGTGYGSTTLGAFEGTLTATPTTKSLSMAYFVDGYLYNPTGDPHVLERIHVSASSAEVCDGVDNDCDGATDEDIAGKGSVCAPTACATDADCDDGVACTVDTCVGGGQGCAHLPQDASCDDGIACTVDTCDLLAGCTAAPDDAACDDGIACTTDTCDTAAGCLATPNDAACDDGNACNGTESCSTSAGGCVNNADGSCSDGVPCTFDECDGAGGCLHTPSDAACSDGFACTVDACDAAAGCTHTAVASGSTGDALLVDFEDGTAGPLVLSAASGNHAWRVLAGVQSVSGRRALYWGNGSGTGYGYSEHGHADWKVALPDVTGVMWSLQAWYALGNGDNVKASVVDAQGFEHVLWTGTGGSGGWTALQWSLDEWRGDTVTLRLRFNSDGWQNGTGAFFDDLALVYPCTGPDCTAAATCDDGDACTNDVCDPAGNTCYHLATVDCDDGVACTVDTCDPVAGCQHATVAAGSAGVAYEEHFDDGTANGFALSTSSATASWHVVEHVHYQSHAGALYFGNGDAASYPYSTTGTAALNAQLAPVTGNAIDFGAWYNLGNGDSVKFQVVDDQGLVTTLWTGTGSSGGWTAQHFSLDEWRGETVTLQWVFHSDGWQNGPGVFLDDVVLTAGCDGGGACTAALDCDDGDPCTVDACDAALGSCYHAQATSCDDGSACTVDTCDPATGCQHTVAAAGVGGTALSESFDDGVADGFTLSAPAGNDSWHIVQHVHYKSHAGALYYGNPGGSGYGYNHNGTASLVVTPAPVTGNDVSFQAWYSLGNADWVKFQVVDAAGLVTTLWTATGSSGGWTPKQFSLDEWRGETVTLQWVFHSDGWQNGTGFFLDDVVVTAACDGGGACAVAADCNDGDACTVDLCHAGSGSCYHSASVSCDDGAACTVDTCDPVAGCQHVAVSAGSAGEAVSVSFDDGTAPGFAFSAAAGGDEWRVVKHVHYVSHAGALYYGNANGTGYGYNHNGTASIDVTLAPVTGNTVTFQAWHSLGNADWVKFQVVDAAGMVNTLWTASGSSGGWTPKQFSLDEWRGETVTLQWVFHSDGWQNGTGFFLDDLVVTAGCDGGGACATAADCDDGDACTVDDCDAGLGNCYHAQSTSCDDGVACTLDTCDSVLGCQHSVVASGGTGQAMSVAFDDGTAPGFTFAGAAGGDDWRVLQHVHYNSRAGALYYGNTGGTAYGYNRNGTASVDVAVAPVAGNTVSFQAWYSLGNGDWVKFQVVTSSGATTVLWTASGSSNNAWISKQFSLDGWLGETVTLQWVFHSDGWQNGTGFFLDDLVVTAGCDGGGACASVADCSDGDVCTVDTCDPSLGNCYHAAQISCDDGIPCTADSCDPATGCQHTAIPAGGVGVVSFEDFDDGVADLMNLGGSWNGCSWHIVSHRHYTSGTSALYYGNASGTGYCSGLDYYGVKPAATLPVHVAPITGNEVVFEAWFDTESNADFVRLELIDERGVTHELWKASGTSAGWEHHVVSLDNWLGETVTLRWRFSSDGSLAKTGVFIDDIAVHAPCTGATCQTAADCDDGDACTVDVCNASLQACYHDQPTPCDDGLACTDDTCDALVGCQHATTPAGGSGVAYTENFDDGVADQVTLTGAWNGCAWRVVHNVQYASGRYALYYGNASGTGYCNGLDYYGVKPAATLSVHVAPIAGNDVAFDTWFKTESGADFVRLELVDERGNTHELWKASGTSAGWEHHAFSLDSWLGETVTLHWRFSSDGSVANTGVFLDNIEVHAPCTGATCQVAADCDDGDACTLDACNNGLAACYHDQPTSCDDGLACTDDTCDPVAGCQHTPTPAGTAGVAFAGNFDDGTVGSMSVSGGWNGCAWRVVHNVQYASGRYALYYGNASATAYCNSLDYYGVKPVASLQVQLAPVAGNDVSFAVWYATEAGYDLVHLELVDAQGGVHNLWSASGSSNGWQTVSVSLDAWKGQQVTVRWRFSSDGSVSGTGVFLDDIAVHVPCNGATCQAAGQCNDGDVCTTDTCDVALQACYFTPIACDDGVACTVDSCDPTTGCVFTPDDAACSDGDACNGAEVCDPVTDCQPGTPLVCDDGDPCTVDGCSASLGCVTGPALAPGCSYDGEQVCMLWGLTGDTVDCVVRLARDGNAEPAPVSLSVDLSWDAPVASVAGLFDLAGTALASGASLPNGATITATPADPTTWSGTGTLALSGPSALTDAIATGYDAAGNLVVQGTPDLIVVRFQLLADVALPVAVRATAVTATGAAGESMQGRAEQETLLVAAGGCSAAPAWCDDGNPCTNDACDAVTGACTYTPADGAACDDGSACTVGDTCQASTCAGTFKACAAGCGATCP